MRALKGQELLILVMLFACASLPPLPEGLGGHLALESWRGESSLYIKYTGPDGLIHATADWSDQIVAQAPPIEAVSLVVVEPGTVERASWRVQDDSLRPIPILHASDFARFRDRVVEGRVPTNGRSAIAVDMGHDFDVALFFDQQGHFRTVQGALPEGVEIVERYSLEEFLELAPETLERLLAEQGIFAREVLFNTGDQEDDALPFLYVNLDRDLGAFVRIRRLGALRPPPETVVPITPSITHFFRSHSTSLVNRPMSSLTRLLFAFTSAATDTFDAAPLPLITRQPIPDLYQGPGMDLDEWESELDRLTGRTSDRGELEFLLDGEAFFSRLEGAIREAQRKIDIRIYIFDNDDVALDIADRLRARSNQGIDIRVLLDGMGTLAASTIPPAELPMNYEVPSSIGSYLESGSNVRVRQLPNPFFTGDHSKAILVDEERAFVGGMNIGREYRFEWHDMMVEVTGPVVTRLSNDFDVAWAGAGPFGDLGELFARIGARRTSSDQSGYPIRVLYTSVTASEIRKTQLEAIRNARSYIYVENAYLTDDAFFYELVRARRRGVDVRVVVSMRSDQGQLTRDNILTANALFENGIRVYIYPGMSHLKAAVFDGWACVGSANLDQLSLRINKELNLATSVPEAVEALVEALFEKDFASSPEMQEPFAERWVDSLWELVGDYFF